MRQFVYTFAVSVSLLALYKLDNPNKEFSSNRPEVIREALPGVASDELMPKPASNNSWF